MKSDNFNRIFDDWKMLVDHMKLGRDKNDKAYMSHAGKPLIAVWGIGFNDDRGYSMADCEKLIDFLKDDPTYGGNTVMIGVPYYWREQKRDTDADPALHRIIKKADIISPWTVGRFGANRKAVEITKEIVAPDVAKCTEIKKTICPSFSQVSVGLI